MRLAQQLHLESVLRKMTIKVPPEVEHLFPDSARKPARYDANLWLDITQKLSHVVWKTMSTDQRVVWSLWRWASSMASLENMLTSA